MAALFVKDKITRKNNSAQTTYSFLNAAEKVLSECYHGATMHYSDITKKAFEKGWLVSEGQTPEASMISRLVTHIKDKKFKGEPARFFRSAPGYYGLVHWEDSSAAYQASSNNIKIRSELLAKVKMLTPTEFERLIGENLLPQMGFDDIEITTASRDGGIDVRGTMLISNIIRIKMAIQAKRWQNNIQSPTVQALRGSLGIHEQGLIITTSDYSKGATKEANQFNKTPISLMNGEELVNMMIKHGVGVKSSTFEFFELEEDFW